MQGVFNSRVTVRTWQEANDCKTYIEILYHTCLYIDTLSQVINDNKSYDDSVKLKRTEMDPFRLG